MLEQDGFVQLNTLAHPNRPAYFENLIRRLSRFTQEQIDIFTLTIQLIQDEDFQEKLKKVIATKRTMPKPIPLEPQSQAMSYRHKERMVQYALILFLCILLMGCPAMLILGAATFWQGTVSIVLLFIAYCILIKQFLPINPTQVIAA